MIVCGAKYIRIIISVLVCMWNFCSFIPENFYYLIRQNENITTIAVCFGPHIVVAKKYIARLYSKPGNANPLMRFRVACFFVGSLVDLMHFVTFTNVVSLVECVTVWKWFILSIRFKCKLYKSPPWREQLRVSLLLLPS